MNELYKLNLKIYWIDFIISLLLFIICFYITYTVGSIIFIILSAVFLYRVGAFTHEIAHQNNNKRIKVFKIVWNLIGGLLILQPSIRFTIPHLLHHKVGIFATKEDPQYPLIFKDIKLACLIFVLLPWLMPIYNLLICLFPTSFLKNILYKNISLTKSQQLEATFYGYYYLIILLLLSTFINLKFITLFYIVSVLGWFLSVLRIPLEHSLGEYKKSSTVQDQEDLSYTHTFFLYSIIQPLGLRFHKVHHMYPKIPYYNLNKLNKKYK